MLIKCSSCNSKYLINSADLKPNGRNVKCAICDLEWFQDPNLTEEIKDETSNLNLKKENIQYNEEKISSVTNLPSKYIEEEKVSTFNSIIMIFFLVIIIFVFWSSKKYGTGISNLAFFYIHEFYFNLQLIISDISEIIYGLVN